MNDKSDALYKKRVYVPNKKEKQVKKRINHKRVSLKEGSGIVCVIGGVVRDRGTK